MSKSELAYLAKRSSDESINCSFFALSCGVNVAPLTQPALGRPLVHHVDQDGGQPASAWVTTKAWSFSPAVKLEGVESSIATPGHRGGQSR